MTQDPKPNTQPPKNLIEWFAHNHVAANILMMLFLVGGLVSVLSMRTETFPTIDPRLVTISVVYPGATPYEIADSITSRVEETLIGIDGVKRISSKAAEGYGLINVELQDFADADDVYNDVQTAVDSLSDFPPEEAERPKVVKTKRTPNVISLAIHGDAPEETLKYWAELIEDDLRQLDGVATTSLRGIRDYEISIEISEESLREYGLTLQDIGNAVSGFSTDIPAGTLESRQGDILLRVQQQRYHGRDFETIPIKTTENGATLYLSDIATIKDGFEDVHLISKFNGQPAAFIDVSRNDTGDTLTIAQTVKDYLQTVSLPTGVSLSLQDDKTVNLRDRISLMARNAILGFMLVFVVLLLFLDLKLAFWTSVAIPVSFLGGMMIIHLMGYSINMITLFALIVVLGVVVDDAIIVGESIFEAQNKDPSDPNALMKGMRAVIAPVTVGVTTTMAAFGPLAFSTGTLGQIIMIIPVVVIPILFISLMEAYFILPAHLSSPSRWSRGIVAQTRNTVTKLLRAFVAKIIMPVSGFAMRWRYVAVAAFIGFAIITGGMFKGGMIRFIFFPQVESDEVKISVTMPTGTPFEMTQETLLTIEKAAQDVRTEIGQDDLYENMTVSIGQTSGGGGPGGGRAAGKADNIGEVILRLISSDFRAQSALDIETMIRERVEDLPNVEKMEFQSSLVGDDPDIEVELSHADEAMLNQAAEELKEKLRAIKGTTEVADSYEPGKTEYVFELTQEGLAVGLTPQRLGSELRAAFFGLEAERFQRGRSEIIVYVRYPKEQRENLATLYSTRIRLDDGTQVPLSSVARIKKQTGYAQISTVNGRQVVSVTADADYNITTPNDVIAQMRQTLLPALAEHYPGLSYSFEGKNREQAEDLANLGRNMMIALMIIYVILGAQLHSYVQPLLIMTAIPFGVVGAIWGHFLLGHDLTFISLFGIVALSGVVVNDSVVLVDYYNKQIEDGETPHDAALNAISRRFRPILLTTLTTALGLLPVLLETSLQAQFLIPMVISLATGILFSTVIILLLIPCLVVILEDIKSLGRTIAAKFPAPS